MCKLHTDGRPSVGDSFVNILVVLYCTALYYFCAATNKGNDFVFFRHPRRSVKTHHCLCHAAKQMKNDCRRNSQNDIDCVRVIRMRRQCTWRSTTKQSHVINVPDRRQQIDDTVCGTSLSPAQQTRLLSHHSVVTLASLLVTLLRSLLLLDTSL